MGDPRRAGGPWPWPLASGSSSMYTAPPRMHLYKTQMCRSFVSLSFLSPLPPSPLNTHTHACSHVLKKEACPAGDKCMFAHSKRELRGHKTQTVPCADFWMVFFLSFPSPLFLLSQECEKSTRAEGSVPAWGAVPVCAFTEKVAPVAGGAGHGQVRALEAEVPAARV